MKLGHCSLRDYAIISFPEEGNNVSAVPMKWMVDSEDGTPMAWWPPVTSEAALRKLIRDAPDPDMATWKLHPAEFKLEGCTYVTAITKLSKAQYCSDLASDGELGVGKRAKRLRPGYLNRPSTSQAKDSELSEDEEVSEEELSTPPAKRQLPSVPRPPKASTPQIPQISSSNEEFQKKILEVVEKNYAETRRNTALLLELLTLQKEKAAEGLLRGDEFKEIPVNSVLALTGLNTRLADDLALFGKMAAYLSLNAGCRSPEKTCEKVFECVLAHELAVKLNWRGSDMKTSIKPYQSVLDLIVSAVKKNPFSSSATKDEVLSKLKGWLRDSSDRKGGRAKRAVASLAKKAAGAAGEILNGDQ